MKKNEQKVYVSSPTYDKGQDKVSKFEDLCIYNSFA